MQSAKNIPLAVLMIVMIVSTLIAATPFNRQPAALLPTYFNYSEEEVSSLYRFDSSKEMNEQELKAWDTMLTHLIDDSSEDLDVARIYAYLYTAQRDAGYLSYNVKQRFEGSLSPISRKVLSLFFPNAPELHGNQQEPEDAYSNLLSDVIMAKVKARWQADQQGIKPYPAKQGDQYWKSNEDEAMFGRSFGSWKTWFLSSSSQLRPPPPPPYDSPIWKEQILEVKKACAQLTANQKEAIMYWAGLKMDGDKAVQNGDWRQIVNLYLWDHHIPFKTVLLVRSTLAMTLADSMAAAFDAKYTYWVKRPSMLDNNIKIHLPNPNHPSYPSGHSTIGGAASTLLSYFFPQDEQMWRRLAQESGMSRIWCGIHYPIDHQAGLQLGKRVAEVAIESVERSSMQPATL